jgi:membrane-associated PAP2 superfamily phosphatase
MNEAWLVWTIAFLAVIVYGLFQFIRTASMIHSLERPLWKHFKDWDNNVPYIQKRVRNKDFQRDYYAYSRLSPEELIENRITLKSQENLGSFVQAFLDLLWKLSLPLLVVVIGLTNLPSNHPFTVKWNELYQQMLQSLVWITAIVTAFACLVLVQFVFARNRRKLVTYHLLLIDQSREKTS